MATLSPEDRDLVIRTVLSEAGDQPDIGKAAVAHVIANRMQLGRYGGTSAPDVVLARSQFEPWSLPRGDKNHPLAHSARSKAYANAGNIVDDVFTGQSDDPTNGATHFYSPKDQAALGRKAPSWAKGPGLAIGGHTFYAPEGPAKPRMASVSDPNDPDGLAAIQKAIGALPSASGAALAFSDDSKGAPAPAGSLFRDAGFTLPGQPKTAAPATGAQPAAPEASPAAPSGSLFKDAGFKLPTAKEQTTAAGTSGPDTFDQRFGGAGAPQSLRDKRAAEIRKWRQETGQTLNQPEETTTEGLIRWIKENPDSKLGKALAGASHFTYSKVVDPIVAGIQAASEGATNLIGGDTGLIKQKRAELAERVKRDTEAWKKSGVANDPLVNAGAWAEALPMIALGARAGAVPAAAIMRSPIGRKLAGGAITGLGFSGGAHHYGDIYGLLAGLIGRH